MTNLLKTLCAIDSRSRAATAGTARCAEIVAAELSPLGFQCGLVPPPEPELSKSRHLVAVRGTETAKSLVLLGHLDTVLSPDDVPFRLDSATGRVFGSGVSDMKGGIVVMIEAIKRFLETDGDDVQLKVVLNASEETVLDSFPPLIKSAAAGALAALNFEPGYLGDDGEHVIVEGRKGNQRFHLLCQGKAAHAGNHHEAGANAILEITRKVEELQALTDYEAGITVNVGRIEGGRAYNQVPDVAEIELEVRGKSSATLEKAKNDIRRICERTTVRSHDGRFACENQLTMKAGYPAFPENDATRRLVDLYTSVANDLGVTVTSLFRGGSADSNHIADNIPVIDGLGILGGGFHSDEEWADVNSMSLRADVAAAFMRAVVAKPR